MLRWITCVIVLLALWNTEGIADPPSTPRAVDPPNGGNISSFSPTLYSTLYQDLDFSRNQTASQWQISKISADYSSPVFDLTSSQYLTECPIPDGTLRDTVRYFWRIRHQAEDGQWSEWSLERSFWVFTGLPLLDSFDDTTIDPDIWQETIEQSCTFSESGGRIQVNGNSPDSNLRFNQLHTSNRIPHNGFDVSVKFTANCPDNNFDISLFCADPKAWVGVIYQPWAGYTGARVFGNEQHFGTTLPFGDEATSLHKLRVTYDPDLLEARAYVDGHLISAFPASLGNQLMVSVQVHTVAPGSVEATFDDFRLSVTPPAVGEDIYVSSTTGTDPKVTAGPPEPYALTDGMTLDVSVGGQSKTVLFSYLDFAFMEFAQASEVAAVLKRELNELSSDYDLVDGCVESVRTENRPCIEAITGPNRSIQVLGGTANAILQFPTNLRDGKGTETKPYGSISYAIDRTPTADYAPVTFRIAGGTYFENIYLEPFSHLVGGYDPNSWVRDTTSFRTRVDGQQNGIVVRFQNHVCLHANHSTLDGLEIYNGRTSLGGAGVNANCDFDMMGITIVHCNIHDNTADDSSGGGGFLSGRDILIADSRIHDNTARYEAGGIGVVGMSNVEVRNTSFYRNNAIDHAGGGLYTNSALLLCVTCEFFENSCDNMGHGGSGLRIINTRSFLVDNVYVHHNYTNNGGNGAFSCITARGSLVSSTVAYNQADGAGGGIFSFASDLILERDRIVGNQSVLFAGGVDAGNDTGSLIVDKCVIQENSTTGVDSGGGGLWVLGIPCIIRDSEIVNNYAARSSGGMWTGNSPDLVVVRNLFRGNSTGTGETVACSLEGGSIQFKDNVVVNHTAVNHEGSYAGLMALVSSGPFEVKGNIFGSNSVQAGWNFIVGNGDATFENNLFAANQKLGNNQAIFFSGSDDYTELTNNVFVGNRFESQNQEVAGFVRGFLGNVDLQNNTFAYCSNSSRGDQGGLILGWGAAMRVVNNIFYRNDSNVIWRICGECDSPLTFVNTLDGNTGSYYVDPNLGHLNDIESLDALPNANFNNSFNPTFKTGYVGTIDSIQHNTENGRSTLTLEGIGSPGPAVRGLVISPNTNQPLYHWIAEAYGNEVEVYGDMNEIASPGDTFEIFDYHLEDDSPLLDIGSPSGAPADDIDGDPRPIGAGVDIGADEAGSGPNSFFVSRKELTIGEGETGAILVRLAAPPVETVQVAVAVEPGGDPDLVVVSGSMLAFTPGNWSDNQEIVISAGADSDASNGRATLRVYRTAGDLVRDAFVSLVEQDNEAPVPDLVFESATIELETPASCGDSSLPLGIRVQLENVGDGDSSAFTVEVNGATQRVSNLGPSGSTSVWFAGYASPSDEIITIDADEEVFESNEENNSFAGVLPIPTRIPTCTPTASPTPTETFTPRPTPSSTSSPTHTGTHTETATPTPTPVWYADYDFDALGVLAYFPFDDDASDVTGNGNDGTVDGAVLTTGWFGQAYSFDGNDDIEFTEQFSSNSQTICMWVYSDSLQTYTGSPDWHGAMTPYRRRGGVCRPRDPALFRQSNRLDERLDPYPQRPGHTVERVLAPCCVCRQRRTSNHQDCTSTVSSFRKNSHAGQSTGAPTVAATSETGRIRTDTGPERSTK